ncbi:MAG: winged helix-turn-helix domain-containing protein, partial [Candidatus Thorarchaeota archaeon]
RIYLEALLREEITAQHLMGILDIGRSTLGYHLVRMVEAGILEVRTRATGRQTKYYSLSENSRQQQVLEEIKTNEDPVSNLERYIGFLEALTTHLQAVVSLSSEMSMSLKSAQHEDSYPNLQKACHFIFNVLSEEEASYWNQKVTKFLIELEKEIAQKNGADITKKQTHIAFSGVLPIYENP